METSPGYATQTKSEEIFRQWAIVELMGHQKTAGLLSEVTLAGGAFLRLDVPKNGGGMYTQFLSPSAIYRITPCSEEIARVIVKRYAAPPVLPYELPTLPPGEKPSPATEETEEDPFEDDPYNEGNDYLP